MSFDPTIGRWMEADPDLYIDGSNVYQMEKASPEDGLDPTGLFDGPIYPIHAGATTPAAGPANPSAYLYDQGAGVAHHGATPYTLDGKNGAWTAIAFATWGTWASDCGFRLQLTYKPKGDMWDCDEISIIQFTRPLSPRRRLGPRTWAMQSIYGKGKIPISRWCHSRGTEQRNDG